MSMVPNNRSIYVSYSYEDSNWFEYVFPYLTSAARKADVKIWPPDTNRYQDEDEDRKTEPAIETLHNCAVYILLVSPHSQASKFINDVELPIIRQRVMEGEEVLIVPIIVSTTAEIRLNGISDSNLRPRNQKSLSTLTNQQRDREMARIVDQIEIAISRPLPQASIAPQMHPEPNSPTTLLARRVGAEIERFYIPEVTTRQPDRSSDTRYSPVIDESAGKLSASIAASEARRDASFSKARTSPAERDALRRIMELELAKSRKTNLPDLSTIEESDWRAAPQADYSERSVELTG